ncbi:thiopurine S-methyltransferase [Thiolinea disciformis]|uniref:thiopurine S-methyltransferase n=1 Tax=Thiolinea disciformis TaxID=125614 RepID=UPI00036DBEFC|nr:thiopurine S-methyltransferase [Thiolinea disciformis]
MQAEFWHQRWQKNQIGFHQSAINSHLESFWPQLNVPEGTRVFVPLCGKSLDMLWLRAQGYPVLGIELSEIAVRDFFAENELTPVIQQQGSFTRWETENLVILVGDFFDLTAADLAECGAVYDRASLIALPPAMRPAYAEHFLKIVSPSNTILLITVEYDQSIASGPPFSVSEQEVRDYYEATYKIVRIYTIPALDTFSGFRNKGITELDEHVFFLKPR